MHQRLELLILLLILDGHLLCSSRAFPTLATPTLWNTLHSNSLLLEVVQELSISPGCSGVFCLLHHCSHGVGMVDSGQAGVVYQVHRSWAAHGVWGKDQVRVRTTQHHPKPAPVQSNSFNSRHGCRMKMILPHREQQVNSLGSLELVRMNTKLGTKSSIGSSFWRWSHRGNFFHSITRNHTSDFVQIHNRHLIDFSVVECLLSSHTLYYQVNILPREVVELSISVGNVVIS